MHVFCYQVLLVFSFGLLNVQRFFMICRVCLPLMPEQNAYNALEALLR
jgi:hypothetical protein